MKRFALCALAVLALPQPLLAQSTGMGSIPAPSAPAPKPIPPPPPASGRSPPAVSPGPLAPAPVAAPPPPLAAPAVTALAWLGPVRGKTAEQLRKLAAASVEDHGMAAVDDGENLLIAEPGTAMRRQRSGASVRELGQIKVAFTWMAKAVPVGGPAGETWLALAITAGKTAPADEVPPPPAGWDDEYGIGDPRVFEKIRLKVLRTAGVDRGQLCSAPSAFASPIQGHVNACCAMAWSAPAPAHTPPPRTSPPPRYTPPPRRVDATPSPPGDEDSGGRPVLSFVGFSYNSMTIAGPARLDWGADISATVGTTSGDFAQWTRFEIGYVSPGGFELTMDMLYLRQFGSGSFQLAFGGGAGVSRFGDNLSSAMDLVGRVHVASKVGDGWAMVWYEPVWLKFADAVRKQGSGTLAPFADQARAGVAYTFARGGAGRWGVGGEVVEVGGSRIIKLMVGLGTWR